MPSLAFAATVAEPANVRFSVQARAEPGVLPRLVELFAKRGIVPERWQSAVLRPEMRLSVDVEVAGLERDIVDYVANCMRQIVGVELVLAL